MLAVHLLGVAAARRQATRGASLSSAAGGALLDRADRDRRPLSYGRYGCYHAECERTRGARAAAVRSLAHVYGPFLVNWSAEARRLVGAPIAERSFDRGGSGTAFEDQRLRRGSAESLRASAPPREPTDSVAARRGRSWRGGSRGGASLPVSSQAPWTADVVELGGRAWRSWVGRARRRDRPRRDRCHVRAWQCLAP